MGTHNLHHDEHDDDRDGDYDDYDLAGANARARNYALLWMVVSGIIGIVMLTVLIIKAVL